MRYASPLTPYRFLEHHHGIRERWPRPPLSSSRIADPLCVRRPGTTGRYASGITREEAPPAAGVMRVSQSAGAVVAEVGSESYEFVYPARARLALYSRP